jgi:hypothetical protein
MGNRPIRRSDADGVVWELALEDRGDGVWGYWYEVKLKTKRSRSKRPSPGTRFVFTAKQARDFQEHAFSPERHNDERMERKKERAARGRAIYDEAVRQEEAAHERERHGDFKAYLEAGAGYSAPGSGFCPACGRWAFLDGTVVHASYCPQRYWHLTFDSDDGHARRGKAKTEKELLREFKGAGLKSTHEWQVEAPRRGLTNWSTYQRRFRDDDRRREDEPIFDFVRRLSKRVR